jgi:two-component system KDP operon response regulator KdpE
MPSDEAAAGAMPDTEQGASGGKARVLVIDDEPEIRRAVQLGLASGEFTVAWAPNGQRGLEMVAQWHPDIVLLDLSLPDMDGIEVTRALRSWSAVPILILSVRSGDADKITTLELGADDYLTKPFSMGELRARISVALRHAAHAATGGTGDGARFTTGGLALDFARRQVLVSEHEIHLTPTEYEVLKYLAMHAGQVVTHRTLLRAVWGPDYEDEAHYLRVFIGQLRRKIEPEPGRPRYLLTEPGIGYRLRSPE